MERGLYKMKFGYIGMSLSGSIVNNVLQMFFGAMLIKSREIFLMLPLFLIMGSISAVANVYIAKAYERFWEVRRKT